MAVDVDADVIDDAGMGIESGKQFYRTAYCTGVVIVSGHPMQ